MVSEHENKIMLNVGCGVDYREGFVNIDSSSVLQRVDKVIDVSRESLLGHFLSGSIAYILANDILEHLYHWEATSLLKDFYLLLAKGGVAQIRVPDAERIIRSWRMPIAAKLTLLYGGQDLPQGQNPEMDASRAQHPQYFCHKYGWSQDSLSCELLEVGFEKVVINRLGYNMVVVATR